MSWRWSNGWDGRGHWAQSKCRRRRRGQPGRWCLSWYGHRIATGQTSRNSQSQETDDATYHQFSTHGPQHIRLHETPDRVTARAAVVAAPAKSLARCSRAKFTVNPAPLLRLGGCLKNTQPLLSGNSGFLPSQE